MAQKCKKIFLCVKSVQKTEKNKNTFEKILQFFFKINSQYHIAYVNCANIWGPSEGSRDQNHRGMHWVPPPPVQSSFKDSFWIWCHMKHTKMATVTLLDFMLMTISLNLKCLVNKTLKNFGKLGNCKVGMDESYPWHFFPPTIKLPITQIIYPLIYISEFLLLNWVPYLSPLHPHICMRLQVRHYSVGLSSLLQFIN